MESVILVIHLIVALAIIAVILVQPSESGGFLGNSGSMSNLMSQRRVSDPLTRLTAILVTIFFTTSLVLAIMAEHRGANKDKSILDAIPAAEKTVPPATTAPTAPAAPTEPAKKEMPSAPISR